MGYLDNAGLAYLWSKVKAALAGKQNVLTAGDGIQIEGDTISSTSGGNDTEQFPEWGEATLPSSADWMSVTYGNGRFVAVANGSNKAVYSADGITWTAATLPSSASWQSVAYGNGKFVAVAYNKNFAAYATMAYVTFDDLYQALSSARYVIS